MTYVWMLMLTLMAAGAGLALFGIGGGILSAWGY
jgi:hypothetical protein